MLVVDIAVFEQQDEVRRVVKMRRERGCEMRLSSSQDRSFADAGQQRQGRNEQS